MGKIHKSITITQEMEEHIKRNVEIKNFSSWIRQQYEAQFFTIETRVNDLQHTQKKLEKIKREIRDLKKQKNTFMDAIPPPAKKWLNGEGRLRARKIQAGQITLEAVYAWFVNEWNLRRVINRRQFKILLGLGGEK